MSLYPENLAAFRAYLDGFDEMLAADLNELLLAAVDIETEMGVQPSGLVGTVHSRLFGNGNISDVNAGWSRLKWDRFGMQGQDFDRSLLTGFGITYSETLFNGGPDTVWSDDDEKPIPGIFGSLQFQLNSGVGATGRGGQPWKHAINLMVRGSVAFFGEDGEDNSGDNELNSGNTAGGSFGILFWGLYT